MQSNLFRFIIFSTQIEENPRLIIITKSSYNRDPSTEAARAMENQIQILPSYILYSILKNLYSDSDAPKARVNIEIAKLH
jgi:hypothetical protein